MRFAYFLGNFSLEAVSDHSMKTNHPLCATVLATFACFLAGVLPLFAGSNKTRIPETFKTQIWGFRLYNQIKVHVDGHTVTYERFKRGSETETIQFNPTSEEWEKFNALLAEAGVWGWEDEYPVKRLPGEPELADGTSWSLIIKEGPKEKKATGKNAYPPNWDKFREAVRVLIKNNMFE